MKVACQHFNHLYTKINTKYDHCKTDPFILRNRSTIPYVKINSVYLSNRFYIWSYHETRFSNGILTGY